MTAFVRQILIFARQVVAEIPLLARRCEAVSKSPSRVKFSRAEISAYAVRFTKRRDFESALRFIAYQNFNFHGTICDALEF